MNTNKKLISLIKEKIAKYSSETTITYEEGKVISNRDGIIIASGLNSVMLNELVKFENGSYGLVLNLFGISTESVKNAIVKPISPIIATNKAPTKVFLLFT